MERERQSFLHAAGSSLVLGAGRVWSASAAAPTPVTPVSFPGVANPQEGGFAPIAGRVSNCAFGPGRYLYVTNDTQVRGRIRTGFPGAAPIQY